MIATVTAKCADGVRLLYAAAICCSEAAKYYRVPIVHSNIANVKVNRTLFCAYAMP